VRGEIRAVGNTLRMTQAAYAAEGGVELGVLNLLTPQAQRWPTDGSPFETDFGEAHLRIAILDEAGKIDLNAAGYPLLNKLLLEAGVEPDRAGHVADAILDWRDTDDLRRVNGAEDGDYRIAGLEYGPTNSSFLSVDELQLVLGMDTETFEKIRPVLTVYSGLPGVNPRFASPQVTAVIDGLAEAQTNANGLVYTIYVEAVTADDIASRLAATVTLTPDGTGKPYQVLAWKPAQGDIFSRTEATP
jgi:general secretion pathway protein K